MNPKSITMGELYGEEDPLTMEWKDGLMPKEFFENFKSMNPILQRIVDQNFFVPTPE